MLQLEVYHDIFMWLRRKHLDAVQIATKFFKGAVTSMPTDSPMRSIQFHVLSGADGQGVVANVVDNEGDGTWTLSNEGYRKLTEAHELALYVTHANITVFSYVSLVETDWPYWIGKFRCLEGRLMSTMVTLTLLRCSPVPEQVLHIILRDICNTTKGLDLLGNVDYGSGALLRLPAMRACPDLRIGDNAAALANASEVENYVEWLHLPTDGLYASGQMLPPYAARRLLNLKVTDEVFETFLEALIERFRGSETRRSFYTTLIFPHLDALALHSGLEPVYDEGTGEKLTLVIKQHSPGTHGKHAAIARMPLIDQDM